MLSSPVANLASQCIRDVFLDEDIVDLILNMAIKRYAAKIGCCKRKYGEDWKYVCVCLVTPPAAIIDPAAEGDFAKELDVLRTDACEKGQEDVCGVEDHILRVKHRNCFVVHELACTEHVWVQLQVYFVPGLGVSSCEAVKSGAFVHVSSQWNVDS